MDINETELLTVSQAAEYTGKSRQAIYNIVHAGKVAYFKNQKGDLRFRKCDLDELIKPEWQFVQKQD